ncbi:lipase secretion chaperone [Hydrocarboniclastica marina]|uniref:Lipase chaperone n=1 Tax=Hydrocarboniclastica marina TaxID=2259620 RepID=A0A4P7XK38_9ALTE|nr:lipase secretion chaperone [Hydrocarboniclastica marina]QCF27215.1 hypothetical protein soil367_15470 [Hydrocarboniclastica marina]
MSKRRYVGLSVFLLITVSLAFFFAIPPEQETTPSPAAKDYPDSVVAETTGADKVNVVDAAQLVERIAVRFLETYGDTIDQPATQAQLFEERRLLLSKYPSRGAALFEDALALAFPELKDQILALLAKLSLYYEWLDEQELRLQGLETLQRQAAVWQKREEIFGQLASQLWADEENAIEKKSEAFQQELTRLNEAEHLSLQELAYQLQATVDNLYDDDLATRMTGAGTMGRTLFSMNSVQNQLKSLPNEERQAKINELRRQLGYPEDAVERLAKLDQEREQKWQNGEAYMAQRQQLQQSLSGRELDNAMQRLRQEYFGSSAPTIAREEEEDFFRFERGRRYGVN